MPGPLRRILSAVLGLFLVLSLAGCPKPHVDVPPESGNGGMFCVTSGDCDSALVCQEQVCCGRSDCPTVCTSLLEKDGSSVHVGIDLHPSMGRVLRRKCLALCCRGENTSNIERTLGAWVPQEPHYWMEPGGPEP